MPEEYPVSSARVRLTRCYATSRPQVIQYFQPTSSSALHAGQCFTVRLWPQWGQKITSRPSGRVPPQ
jgi:hypothetical protein